MATTVAPFEIVPEMVDVAELYTNEEFIADIVCPRIQVGTKEFQYKAWDVERAFTFPPSKVGRISTPNRVEDKWVLKTAICEDHGFDRPLPSEDIRNAQEGAGVDLRLSAAEYLSSLLGLAREVRVANLIFSSSNYAAGLFETLVGTDQWSDFTNSTPLNDIMEALEAPLLRPNIIAFGLDSWVKFRAHPQIVEAVNGSTRQNAAQQGIISTAQVAALFDVRRVVVGRARKNTAGKGLTPVLARVYNDSCALLHINTSVRSTFDMIPTFCFTAQWGEKVAGTIQDSNLGMRGGEHARVGESVLEKGIANQAGYLFLDTVA